VVEQLAPIELNPDCLEKETVDRIMDSQVKGTRQQHVHLYRVVKAGQFLHQGKWLTQSQIQLKLPHLILALDAMGTIAS
jgi:hypothetical protein